MKKQYINIIAINCVPDPCVNDIFKEVTRLCNNVTNGMALRSTFNIELMKKMSSTGNLFLAPMKYCAKNPNNNQYIDF